MPKIQFQDREIQCQPGENLRRVLMRAGVPPYNGLATAIHCRGLGTCGTCAVEVQPSPGQSGAAVSPPTRIESWRLSFPPHEAGSGLRLACQCTVQGDLSVIKHGGLWGQRQKPSADNADR